MVKSMRRKRNQDAKFFLLYNKFSIGSLTAIYILTQLLFFIIHYGSK